MEEPENDIARAPEGSFADLKSKFPPAYVLSLYPGHSCQGSNVSKH